MEWKTVIVAVLLISLMFIAIPIKVPQDKENDVILFETYISNYNKSYRHNPNEYDEKFRNFKNSLRNIAKLNNLRMSPRSAYYGITNYSDLTPDEFLKLTLHPGLSKLSEAYQNHHRKKNNYDNSVENLNRYERAIGIPAKFDWRTKGVVTPVKNQGTCGACWAYSTVECIESMYAIKNGTLKSFSVQEMIDCSSNNFGCSGGDICSLLSWLVINKTPVINEFNYPVTGTANFCKLDRSTSSGIRVGDFTCQRYVGMEKELLNTLMKGPVAVAVNALNWQNYLGGIIEDQCSGEFSMLNHAVQIVGFDKTGEIPFYIVRNSWGSYFGDNGYLYIAIGNNICGIANQVSSVTLL